MQLTVLLWQEDWGYSASCPPCGNVAATGEDRAEAMANLEAAVAAWLADGGMPERESTDVLTTVLREALASRSTAGLGLAFEFVPLFVERPAP